MTTTSQSSSAIEIGSVSNLANLLPTGTLLAFEALIAPFSDNGTCATANTVLTAIMIAGCLIACVLLSFTDSFIKDNKLYFGIATPTGFHVFNGSDSTVNTLTSEQRKKLKITWRDYWHALGTGVVFLAFAFGNANVKDCFFPHAGNNGKELVQNLPLGAAVIGSFLFMLFPTRRRGFGYADTTTKTVSSDDVETGTNSSSAQTQSTTTTATKNSTST